MNKENLVQKKCVPCEGGVPPLKGEALQEYLDQVAGWEQVNEHHIVKTYTFPDFVAALSFVNKIGDIAEQENHHPDICFGWGKVEVTLWTHAVSGLSENDFILAAKIDQRSEK